MQAWISTTHSHEDGPPPVAGKHVILHGSKEDVAALADFVCSVADFLRSHDFCHMHFRDHVKNWDGAQQFDIEVNVDERQ